MVAPFQPAVGMLFGEFRIVRPLSAGGMGAVYIAEQASTGKLRALKLMHPQLCADARLRERFEQEARVGALVESDHVVQVIGAGVDAASGVPWLAMELLEGEDLSQRMRRSGLLPAQDVHEIFRQLCHALGAAHRAGVVHRDMKPQNVFLAKTQSATARWSVKVLDFGIAKIAAEASTMATASLGTPLWMAPEQTDARGQISPATDVWALGLIAFALLTGRMYWRAANDPMGTAMPVLLREILFEPIDPASVRATALGRAGCIVHPFDAWFARCVAREPSQRFQTAQEAFDALGPALFVDPRSARPAGAAISVVPLGAAAAITSAGSASRLSMTGPTEVASDARRAPSTPAPVLASSGPAEAPARPARRGPMLLACGLAGAFAMAVIAFYAGRAQSDVRLVQRLPVPAHPTVVNPGRGDARSPALAGDASERQPSPGSRDAPVPAPAPRSPRPMREGGTTPAATAIAARPFDRGAAHAALQAKADTARIHCKGKAGPKAVTARVFFNPAGAVQRISIEPQVAMTPAGGCVQMLLGSARVPAFDGSELQDVTTTVGIE
ncbi:serine/threonine-protein kinase [Sorangium atrum]|uniref:Protein kinase n=1 Tax=Sorangium atrum TaxID=2995308 RepID=A0ABT5BV21_9BACT|nr:serine/threonine protein kinase [Sorangium aterium]MDC0677998.1 protein kinase [Sorangium aterium]